MSGGTVIPLLVRSGEAEWLSALRAASADHAPGLLDIRAGNSLSADQRARAEIAIADNPHPSQLRGLPALKWVHSL